MAPQYWRAARPDRGRPECRGIIDRPRRADSRAVSKLPFTYGPILLRRRLAEDLEILQEMLGVLLIQALDHQRVDRFAQQASLYVVLDAQVHARSATFRLHGDRKGADEGSVHLQRD